MKLVRHTLVPLLLSALLLPACRQEDPRTASRTQEPQEIAQLDDTPKVNISLDIEAGMNSELRALGNLLPYHGRLRPSVTESKVRLLVLLGSTTATNEGVSVQELDFAYLADTRSLRYQGQMQINANLLSNTAKAGLRMMLIAAPVGSYNASNKTIRMEPRFAEKSAMEAGNGFVVPYFSDWIDVSGHIVSGQHIDLVSDERPDENRIILKPQGQVIKIDVQDTQTLIAGTELNKIIFESNVMSRSGSYSLPVSAGATAVWAPENKADGSDKFGAIHPYNSSVYKYELPITPRRFASTQTFYTWVEARPGVSDPYTRSYLQVKVSNPILTESYIGGNAWWDGRSGERRVIVDYSDNNLSSSGRTIQLNYGRQQAATTISRFTATYVANSSNASSEPASNALPFNVLPFPDRQVSGTTRYTWQLLANNNWIGNSPNPIMLNSSPNATDRNKEWRIPTIDELTNILPYANSSQTSPSTRWFSLGTDNNLLEGNYQQEVAVLGGKGATAKQYGAFFTRPQNSLEVYGLRFMAIHAGQGLHTPGMEIRHNRNATFFQYRLLSKHDGVGESIQVQAAYLGEYFPDIVGSITKFRPYTTFFKEFLTPDERVVCVPRGEKNAQTSYTGPTIWVDAPIANGTGQAFYRWNLTTGETGLQSVPQNALNSRLASLLLIRDL